MTAGARHPASELADMSATELAALVTRRDVSPVEIVASIFKRIDTVDPHINAFVTLLHDEATARAADAERRVMSADPRELGPLFGLPVTVKDLTPTAGVRTTYGSPHFRDNVPTTDAEAWVRIKSAGAILVGKTTTPEFGWLAVTQSRLTGITANPWNTQRTAGGSSGGAAAAVAATMGPLATGSDGAGSIRLPAAFCGVVGFKPSLGRVSIVGEDLVFPGTEAVGPITRTVDDARLLLSVMQGPDERDPFTIPDAAITDHPEAGSLVGLTVAFCPNLGDVPVDADVADAVARTARCLDEDLGATVEQLEVDLLDPIDHLQRFWGAATAVFLDELAAGGADLSLSEPGLLAMAERGRRTSGPELWQTMIIDREAIHSRIAEVLRHSDVLVTPTAPITAFDHPGVEGGPAEVAGRVVQHRSVGFLPFTAPFNMTGHPAISIPCGMDRDGLPIGVQIVGRHGADELVLRVAGLLEHVHPWPTSPDWLSSC